MFYSIKLAKVSTFTLNYTRYSVNVKLKLKVSSYYIKINYNLVKSLIIS